MGADRGAPLDGGAALLPAWFPRAESPILNELVLDGRLPPVAERVTLGKTYDRDPVRDAPLRWLVRGRPYRLWGHSL